MSEDSENTSHTRRTTSPMQDYSECSVCIGISVLLIGLYFSVLLPFLPKIGVNILGTMESIITGIISSYLVARFVGIRNSTVLRQLEVLSSQIESRTGHSYPYLTFFILYTIIFVYFIGGLVIKVVKTILYLLTGLFSINIPALGILLLIFLLGLMAFGFRSQILKWIISIGKYGRDTELEKSEKERVEDNNQTTGEENLYETPTRQMKRSRLTAKGSVNTPVKRGKSGNWNPQEPILDDLQFTIRNQIEEIRGKRRQATRHLEITILLYGIIPVATGVFQMVSLSSFFDWLLSWFQNLHAIGLTLGIGSSLFSMLGNIWIIQQSKSKMGLHNIHLSSEDNGIATLSPERRIESYRDVEKANRKILKNSTYILTLSYFLTLISLGSFILAISL